MDRWKPLSEHDTDGALALLWASKNFRVQAAVAVVLMMLTAPITFWMFDNTRPYDFDGDKSLIIPSTAQGGDQVIVMWKVQHNRTCPGLIRRELFDPNTNVLEAIYDTSDAALALDAVKNGYLNKTFALPKAIKPGWYGYRSHLEYYCNPLQRLWPLKYTTPTLMLKVQG